MIEDPAILAHVRAEWEAVRRSKDCVALNLASAMGGIDGIGQSHRFRNLAYALCLLYAFSVLEQVLVALRDQGAFVSRKSQLGSLMVKSKGILPWQNYELVDQGRIKRNEIAHQQAVIERADTWRFIDAIEAELRAWQIVT